MTSTNPPGTAADNKPSLQALLKAMIDRRASDLHITAGSPPMLRIDGVLMPVRSPSLQPKDAKDLCYTVLTEAQRAQFEAEQEVDLSFNVKGLARFRANVFCQRGAVAGVFRQIPFEIKSIEELGLPAVLFELCKKPRGLILFVGPTGSGKSTSLAAVIDHINAERRGHIVTIEDPIEFLHVNKSCLVNQRELGTDTKSFRNALKYVLRQDPDVVLIGEARDLDTFEAALTIAETGHLTFATMHTNSAVQTITRVVDMFPPHQQSQVRAQLSFSLEAVICQQLVPRVDGGRALAAEVLIASAAIRSLIREDKIHQIYNQMQMGQSKSAMQTMNQALFRLVQQRIVAPDVALGKSSDPDELRTLLNMGR